MTKIDMASLASHNHGVDRWGQGHRGPELRGT